MTNGYHASLNEKLRNVTIRNRKRIDEIFRQALEETKKDKPVNRRKS